MDFPKEARASTDGFGTKRLGKNESDADAARRRPADGATDGFKRRWGALL
jgi:hypothetical protein